jgi:hypothetical protein
MFPCNWYPYCGGIYYYHNTPNDGPFQRKIPDFEDKSTENRSDPPPILSNPAPSVSMVFKKELSGYPNYGNPSGNADILYTNNRGTWAFNLLSFLPIGIGGSRRAQLVIRGALDDHYNVSENLYRAAVTFNGARVHNGPVPFVHGRPFGQMFENWRELILDIPPGIFRINNRVVIENTSNAGDNDFMALDWMEIRFTL